jgi:hypothetical protein
MFIYIYAAISIVVGVLSTIGIGETDFGKVGIGERLFLFVISALFWPILLIVCIWWLVKTHK